MTDWVPGIVSLVGGLGAGASALLWARQNAQPKSALKPSDERLIELDGKARVLLEQLRELNADRHLYDAPTFAAEKARLEQAAAAALRSRDSRKSELRKKPPKKDAHPLPAAEAKSTWVTRHPQLIGSWWGASLVAFFWLVSVLLSQEPAVERMASAGSNDARYEAVLVLSAISLSVGEAEKTMQLWQGYMNQPVPRHRPPMLQKPLEWLEKVINGDKTN